MQEKQGQSIGLDEGQCIEVGENRYKVQSSKFKGIPDPQLNPVSQ
jgi:hypothetical protein